MKRISLSQGLFALVDDRDYENLSKVNWHVSTANNRKYAVRHVYTNIDGIKKDKIVRMHRVIMKAPADMLVDHKDNNTLNNQRENLRVCTKAENNRNVSPRKDNKFGYKGVNYKKGINRFRAYISTGVKCLHLGYFKTAKEAAAAYNKAAKKYHGEFAYLNVIK